MRKNSGNKSPPKNEKKPLESESHAISVLVDMRLELYFLPNFAIGNLIMVEAQPTEASLEYIAELEEQIFEDIDSEIRAFHDWCKDMVAEISERIDALAKKHRTTAARFLGEVRDKAIEMPQMMKLQAFTAIE